MLFNDWSKLYPMGNFPLYSKEQMTVRRQGSGEQKEPRQGGRNEKTGEQMRDSWCWLLNCLMEYFVIQLVNPKVFKTPVSLGNNVSLLI